MRPFLLLALSLSLAAWPTAAQTPDALPAARTAFALGDYGAVIDRLAADPLLPPEAARLLGLSYQARQQHEQAVETLLLADTSTVAVLAALARSYDRLGEPDQALGFYQHAYRKDSTNQAVGGGLARLLGEAGQWPAVVDLYRYLLDQDPENSYLHTQLGTAYHRTDATEQAIVHYERARRLNPRNARAVLNLSIVYFNTDHIFSARRVIEEGLDEHPRNPAFWQRRGEITLAEDDYEAAEESFANAITYGDSTATNHRNLGVARYLQGDLEQALQPLEIAFTADSLNTIGAFYLGMTHQGLENFDDALRYLDHATVVGGQDLLTDIHVQRATTLDRMDRDGDAIQVYRLARMLAPRRIELLFHLGALYDVYHADDAAALKHYEDFLAAVSENQFMLQQNYARQRVTEIREAAFFENQGKPVATKPDSSDGEQR